MYNATIATKAFYNTDKVNFSQIDNEKLNDILSRAKKINELYLSTGFKPSKAERYIRIMELINCNYRKGTPVKNEYASTSVAEKLLLFMFSVDPEFEAAIIAGSEDRTENIKIMMKENFGIYDINLIKIEKFVIKRFLSESKRNEIYEEIDRRAFK